MGSLEPPHSDACRSRDYIANHASTSTSTGLGPKAPTSNISAFNSSSTATADSRNPTCDPMFDLDTSDAQMSRDSAHGRFQGTIQQMDPSAVMKEVLDKLHEDGVPGPQLLRLYTEYNLELGKGTQFRVTAASRQHRIMLQRAHESVSGTQLKHAVTFLSDSVVKRAHWIPEHIPRGVPARTADQELSGEILKKELHNQLQSAKVEIDKLCKPAIRKHRNIVELRAWGLCLDTFEEVTPLNTRIPLLLLERASCNLGDFLASSAYDHTPYIALHQICTDIGAGLGGLHQGNIAHGDMKPENVLLFRIESQTGPSWIAKLCDFGNAESKPDQVSTGERTRNGKSSQQESNQVSFEYSGTPGWTPPEDLKVLNFEGLKLCDIFVYGLIVSRIFDTDKSRGCFDMRTQRRMRTIAAPIDEENMPAYRKQDRAYQKAAEAIRKSDVVPLHDRNRILRVLRAALQPMPRFRDRRPWRFLNNTYYPNIRNVDEMPGRQSKEDPSFALSVVKSALLPYYTYQARNFSNATLSSLNVARNYTSILAAHIRPFFPVLRRESQEQQVFEEIFHQVSDPIKLGRDVDGLQPLDHNNGVHELVRGHSFSSYLYDQGDKYHDALAKLRFRLQSHDMTAMISCEMRELDDQVNAYARLRSRIKLCCWNELTKRNRALSMNCLEFFLKYSLHNDEARAILPQRTSPQSTLDNRILSTVAWLCRGEVGEHELKTMSSPKNIWYATCDSRLSPYLRARFFVLFMQNCCFIGDEFEMGDLNPALQLHGDGRGKTVLRHFLERMMDSSHNVNFRSDLIAQVCTNIVSLKDDKFPDQRRSHANARCFFRGETPEDTSGRRGKSERDYSNTIRTTILHEAVLASCYTAVKCFADSGFPLIVWNHDGKTPLDFAIYYSKHKAALEPWRLVNNNLIIGLLKQKHAKQASEDDLPLGWEETQSGCGTKVYSESTVNPESPSITFKTPQFSLLQERKIAIGSRKSAGTGQEYRFDLVRFIQRPMLDIIQQGVFQFDDDWYKRDILRIKAISGTELSSYEDDRPWIRFPALVASVIKAILFRDYSSILLLLIPLSIAARIWSWNTSISITLSTASLVALARIWDVNLGEIYPNSIPLPQGHGLISVLGSCSIEFCVGISAISRGQTGFAQAIIIGSILCNQLLIPGISLLALGVRHYLVAFNGTTVRLMSNLIILASAFSTILFLFSFTSDNSQVAIEASVLLLSRAAAIIAVVIFLLWLGFRYRTHSDLFDSDAHDGYETETKREPLIGPLAAFVVCALCLAFMIVESDSMVLPVLNLSPATQSSIGIYLIPTIIRLGKHWEILREVLGENPNMEDLALDLTIGFTVNISFYLSPILVLLAWTLGYPLSLAFGLFETIVYGLCGWIPAVILADGRSTFLKGFNLLVVYALITLAFAIYHE